MNYKNLLHGRGKKGWHHLAIAFTTILLLFPAAEVLGSDPVSEPLRQEITIRDRVEIEVDRAFNHTTSLLNILILVLILLPAAIALTIWLLRRTLLEQVTAEFKLKKDAFSQEIAQIKSDSVVEISALITEANAVLTELAAQKSILEQEINIFKHELSSQTYISPNNLVDNSQVTENNSHQELFPETIAIPAPILNAQQHLEQGNAHFIEGRYLQANTSYNEAVKLEPNFPEARYQNARSYAMQRRVNLAIGNLQWAIDIDPKHKEMAKTDSAFDGIRTEDQFNNLIEN